MIPCQVLILLVGLSHPVSPIVIDTLKLLDKDGMALDRIKVTLTAENEEELRNNTLATIHYLYYFYQLALGEVWQGFNLNKDGSTLLQWHPFDSNSEFSSPQFENFFVQDDFLTHGRIEITNFALPHEGFYQVGITTLGNSSQSQSVSTSLSPEFRLEASSTCQKLDKELVDMQASEVSPCQIFMDFECQGWIYPLHSLAIRGFFESVMDSQPFCLPIRPESVSLKPNSPKLATFYSLRLQSFYNTSEFRARNLRFVLWIYQFNRIVEEIGFAIHVIDECFNDNGEVSQCTREDRDLTYATPMPGLEWDNLSTPGLSGRTVGLKLIDWSGMLVDFMDISTPDQWFIFKYTYQLLAGEAWYQVELELNEKTILRANQQEFNVFDPYAHADFEVLDDKLTFGKVYFKSPRREARGKCKVTITVMEASGEALKLESNTMFVHVRDSNLKPDSTLPPPTSTMSSNVKNVTTTNFVFILSHAPGLIPVHFLWMILALLL